MDQHLGYAKHNNEGDNTGNSRNGYSPKTIKTRLGESEVQIPWDRNGDFEPKIVKKYETTSFCKYFELLSNGGGGAFHIESTISKKALFSLKS